MIKIIDCCPNAGGISHTTRLLAKEFGLNFSEPISRHYNRGHGFDYQAYESLEDNTQFIYKDDEGVWLAVARRTEGQPSAWLERKQKLTRPEDIKSILEE